MRYHRCAIHFIYALEGNSYRMPSSRADVAACSAQSDTKHLTSAYPARKEEMISSCQVVRRYILYIVRKARFRQVVRVAYYNYGADSDASCSAGPVRSLYFSFPRLGGYLQGPYRGFLRLRYPCLLLSLTKQPQPLANLSRTYSSTTPAQILFFVLRTAIISAYQRPSLSITLLFLASLYKELHILPEMQMLRRHFRLYSYRKATKSFTAFSPSSFL